MKKLLILIPVGLLATAGLVLTNYGHVAPQKTTTLSTKALVQDPVKLFSLEEHSVRQMIRDGDEKSITSFQSNGDALDAVLISYAKLGIETQSTQKALSQYKKDAKYLTQTASLYSQKLRTYSQFEENHKEDFQVSLDQIGLYDLKEMFKSLDKTRAQYIKEPSSKTQTKYQELSKSMIQMISELYLSEPIETPLMGYVVSHARYLETIAFVYTTVGFETINRLHTNSYTIKAQLEILPKS